MTPAIKALEKLRCTFSVRSYEHTPSTLGYGQEAAEKLGLSVDEVFKTLLITDSQGHFATAIVPVSGLLSLKRAARAMGWKKADMASAEDAQRLTGYVLGGISPFGQKRTLPTLLDSSAMDHAQIHVSAGRRGLEIAISAAVLLEVLSGRLADIGEDRES